MAFLTDADLFYEAMDPCQFMFWDKEDRPYHYMNSYDDSDLEMDGIPGAVLSEIVKSQKARKESQRSAKVVQPCKFFLRGNCRYGSQCRFKHPLTNNMEKPTGICVFFQRGYCRYGNTCHFRHSSGDNVVHTTPSQKEDKGNNNGRCSDFSPSDDDISAGRLTRVRVCFDLPVSGSVPWEKANGSDCFFIEVFVDKRDDDVQYLYSIVEEKVKHPLYCAGMFELCKPGTNLDLSDKPQKLNETSLFLFGSCVDALLIQSYGLASKLLSNESLLDPQRYSMSKLPRNTDGSFLKSDVKAQLKCFATPNLDEVSPHLSHLAIDDSSANDENEPARLHIMQESVGKLVRAHDEQNCSWCCEKGCQCLSNSDYIESDDSELSYQSKASDTRKSGKDLPKSKDQFECGTYPLSLDASSLPSDVQINYGDIVSFGEYPKATFYAVGKSSKLTKLQNDDYIHIPYEIACQMKFPIKKYTNMVQENSAKIGDRFSVCIRNDDPVLLSTFGGSLPTSWVCSAILECGSRESDVCVQYFRIEVGENKHFDAVAKSSDLASDGYYVTSLEDIYQR